MRGLIDTFLICVLAIGIASAQDLPIDVENEIEPIEEFPIEVDALDEFIQSYYALLDNAEYLDGFNFIKHKDNNIEDAANLYPFLYKLMELRSGIRRQVTIFQFGDSHIKPGFFSTTTRSALTEYFCPTGESFSPILSYQFKGVNGGSFQNLLGNQDIIGRCRELKPDLIVVSLGTNDAQGIYSAPRFRTQLETFMSALKECQGEAEIVFTLPPDTNKKGKHNADVAKVSDEIREYAKANGHACWDLAAVMGGYGTIRKWRSQDFASKDMIHFSPKGYMLQGYLFYDALMRAYKTYAENSR
jgi:lysophospholipase L1-like esterase